MFLCLEIGGCPLLVFLGQVALDPGDGDGGPNTSPEEGHDPADLCGVSFELVGSEKIRTT
jgi:hypothetical protein